MPREGGPQRQSVTIFLIRRREISPPFRRQRFDGTPPSQCPADFSLQNPLLSGQAGSCGATPRHTAGLRLLHESDDHRRSRLPPKDRNRSLSGLLPGRRDWAPYAAVQVRVEPPANAVTSPEVPFAKSAEAARHASIPAHCASNAWPTGVISKMVLPVAWA
jgi:hypothetical protein